MAAEGNVPYSIGTVTALFMLMFAVVADLLQVLLTLSGFLAPASLLVTFFVETAFFVWFLIMRVSYFGGKKGFKNLIAFGGGLIVELLPLLDALPATTVAVAFIIWNSRAEDKEKFKNTQPTPVSQSAVNQRFQTANTATPIAASDDEASYAEAA